ncbi:peptidase U32 family protein [Thaumasiovibrio sp. DFM-14]|uniref:peptidase U32 family protein n=1 Tax=Thaumasiovibrio sp. DFM-14 TaxID=3384792 RepID=UPI0039A02DCA
MAVASKQFELLAPGGDIESIKAAIAAGADAIYCGLDRFNARNRATNISFDLLPGLVELAHQHQCQIFITLNVVILEHEIPAMMRLLELLCEVDIDGVIIQDIGLAYLLKHHFPQLDVHASTQLNSHNEGQIQFMKQLGVSRVNLSRELNIQEIAHLAQFGHQHGVLMEVFVHGSYCIGFSGLCYASSYRNGSSGNRGRCSQPCRDRFETTAAGVDHPLNMKDNSAFDDMAALADAGVYSLKIEGRIKKSDYVYTAVEQWRQQIDRYLTSAELSTDKSSLYTVFNRDFSNGYLQGRIGKEMYIDAPRNHAALYRATLENVDAQDEVAFKAIKRRLYDDKTAIIEHVEREISALHVQATKQRSLKGHEIKTVLPKLQSSTHFNEIAQPAILLSDFADISKYQQLGGDIYYKLPNGIARELESLKQHFAEHPQLIPWFPAVLIGDDYAAAVALLASLNTKRVVTENSGIAFYAAANGIAWLAGPQMNITNSWVLHCLKEEFGCVGAFISNELNATQMRRLVCPPDFELHYSLYHPVMLMTSRQCLLQQSLGCRKKIITKGCLPKCSKRTRIKNVNNSTYIIDKAKGEFNQLYADQHCFNPQVINELPDLFSHVLLDFRPIETDTELAVDKVSFYQAVAKHVKDKTSHFPPLVKDSNNKQYVKGL